MNEDLKMSLWTIAIILTIVILIGSLMWALPKYKVYSKELSGKAELKEAEWSRQIAALDAQAEVERAKGVAEANAIIGESLEGNEAYLRYLWIQGLQDGSSEVIYIPTEANLPLLEARNK